MVPQTPSPNRFITYKDIASHCGVSLMTVSRVIRNQGNVKDSTRNRVLAAAEELGYRPNPMVQTLMTGVRRRHVSIEANLAWISTYDPHHPPSFHWIDIHESARERAKMLGYGLETISLFEASLPVKTLKRMLRSRRVAGIIIAPLVTPGTELPVPWDDYPTATIGRSLIWPRIHYTMAHFQHIMDQILEELSKRGYRKIAYLDDSAMLQRQDHSALMAYEYHVNRAPPANRFPPCSCEGWSSRDLKNWIGKHKPDAVISGSTQIHDMLLDAGFSVPDELGYATLSWRDTRPDCAGVRHPFREMGAGVVDLVVAQIHRNERGIPPHSKAMLLEGDWVEGSTLRSTGK
ncbi:MAG: LacI family DNA-binding transcriptional regulator [Kiritimatiellia bacterium]